MDESGARLRRQTREMDGEGEGEQKGWHLGLGCGEEQRAWSSQGRRGRTGDIPAGDEREQRMVREGLAGDWFPGGLPLR